MLPGLHNADGSAALKLTSPTGTALELMPRGENRLVKHTLGGDVDVADLEAVLRPIEAAAGAYARTSGPQRDLAWEKAQWVLAVDAEIARGRTEAEAVQAVMLRPADRWRKLLSGGKDNGDQRCLPNFRRWRKQMGRTRDGRVRRDNWAALVKRRGGGQIAKVDAEFMRMFFQLYLHPNAPGIEPTRRKVAGVFRLRGQGDRIPSEDQVRNAVAKSVTKTLELKYRDQRNQFANLAGGWLRREVNAEAGDIWFMDHRICDWWARTTNEQGEDVMVRPYITAVFDARSFVCIKAIIYADSNPNHERVLEAFQEAVRLAGNRPPRVLYIDNGKDFLKYGLCTPVQLSTKLQAGTMLCDPDGNAYEYSVMQALGTEVITARGYNGKEKPIERWFRDMARDWEKTRDGYVSNTTDTRPDPKDTHGGDPSKVKTVGQAMMSFEQWIHSEANQQMREDGKTRGQIWNERPMNRPPMDDLDLFVRLMLPQRVAPLVRRTSMGGGVAFAGWQYSHADLREYFGQPVMIKTVWSAPRVTVPVQTRKRGKVRREVPACIFVFTLDDRMICGAVADPTFEMFASTEAERARIGAAKHLINAVTAQDSERFHELTGRRQLANPSRVLAELSEAAESAHSTVALTADPSEPTRRMRAANEPKQIEDTRCRPSGAPATASDEDMAAFQDAMDGHASAAAEQSCEPLAWEPMTDDMDGDEDEVDFGSVIMAAKHIEE